MKKSLVATALVGIVFISLALVEMRVVRGTDVNPIDGVVKGVWRIVDSPFYVKINPSSKLEVPAGETLTIEAGVTVYFEASYNLTVKGKLVAGGTRDNRITFAYREGGPGRDKWGGIDLLSTSSSSTITYCNIANAVRAISSDGSSNNILTYNVIRYSRTGIIINAAQGNTITDNEIYECSDSAIWLRQGSQRNEISRNVIYKVGPSSSLAGDGIILNGTSGVPMNIDNKIKDNTIYNCYLSAIKLDHVQTLEISGNTIYANNRQIPAPTWGGSILLRKSNDPGLDYENKDIVIHNNRIHSAAPNGNGTGIALQSARNVRITYNDIYLNDYAGIVVGSNVLLGQVARNNLRNNVVYQAWDSGTSMVWDDGSKGNYWSDYNGTGFVDANNDGIGDVPYTIRGPKGSKDFFPLVSPIYFIATTVSTVTTISASSTVYRFTTTTTIPTYWFTTIYVPLTSYLTTIELSTTTTTTSTTTSTTSYSMALTTFYATSTSYVWTVSVSTTATFYSITYTSTTATTTATSTTTSTTGTTATVTVTTTETAAPRRCVIASAVYGSELSPSVQFLRDFRDDEVLKTFAGAEFMKAFNAFYYSFSPMLAESISANDYARALTRALITPLVAILQTGEAVTWALLPQSEFRVVIVGLIASSLIGLLYASPMIALNIAKAGEERKRRGTPLRYLALVWVCSLVAIGMAYLLNYFGQVGAASFVMMVSTGTLVLSTMILSPLLLLKLIRKIIS